MNESFERKLNELRIEDFLYVVFIVAIIIDLLANNETKKALFGKNYEHNPSKLYIIAGLLVLLVFIFFAIRNYKEMQKQIIGTRTYNLARMRFLGSVLIVIGQLLVVFYLLNVSDIQEGSI